MHYPDLHRAIIDLDRALTNGHWVDHNANQRFATATSPNDIFNLFCSDAYYLSDGGYSRVWYDTETQELRLSGVSTDRVCARWAVIDVRLKTAVEDQLKRIFDEDF